MRLVEYTANMNDASIIQHACTFTFYLMTKIKCERGLLRAYSLHVGPNV